MKFFNSIFPGYTSHFDERVQLQYEYEVLHEALERTEEACHEVEEAIHHLEEDNKKLMQIIQSRQAEQQ